MQDSIQVQSALISVFDKDGLDPIVEKLNALGVEIFSTGGTADYIEKLGSNVTRVESITDYPSILGGRVKTLHPKVFGGILNRRSEVNDQKEIANYEIPPIDLVIVDLYPFEETVASGGTAQEIIEKIDIGGIALIRAAAKNHADVVCVAARSEYKTLDNILDQQKGAFSLEQRTYFATHAFHVSSHYDSAIFNYFDNGLSSLKLSVQKGHQLRYGENPHQQGYFFGDLEQLFEKLNGKDRESFHPTQWRQQVLYIPQHGSSALQGTPESFLNFIASSHHHKKSSKTSVLESLKSQTITYMEKWKVTSPASKLTQPWSQLSGGEAQRILLSIALSTKPKILLLDEPTSALDLPAKLALEQSLKDSAENGLIIVLVTHDEDQMNRLGTMFMNMDVV